MNNLNYNKIFDQLFPICRSITGDGFRKSLKILSRFFNFKIERFKSGKKIFDWIVPYEWNISDAYILQNKKKIVDFKKNNLHVVNYSHSINKILNLDQLKRNLFTIKKYPKYIPYVTSYYKKSWGFCLQYEKFKKLRHGRYKVFINSELKKGFVEYGISKLKGNSKKIMLLTTYLCHPTMANNELSGPLVLLGLYEKIKRWKKKNLNYYFLINPETIGSICFLSKYKELLKKNLQSGLVLTTLGGPRKILSYKKSRIGNSSLDRLFTYFKNRGNCLTREFNPAEGSDERQYCSSELNLPVGQVTRTKYYDYPQYHTSGDTKKFMQMKQIDRSVDFLYKILEINDMIFPLKRYQPFCELQLGKRDLFPNINFYHGLKLPSDKKRDSRKQLNLLLYILSYADGNHDILDLAIKTGIHVEKFLKILRLAINKKLIKHL